MARSTLPLRKIRYLIDKRNPAESGRSLRDF